VNLHNCNRSLLVQFNFRRLFLILKSGVNHTSRGCISTSTLPRIKLRKSSSNIITSNLAYFFFSRRRQHTRCYRDWSSDVCSSDLELALKIDEYKSEFLKLKDLYNLAYIEEAEGNFKIAERILTQILESNVEKMLTRTRKTQIGRASCREREYV